VEQTKYTVVQSGDNSTGIFRHVSRLAQKFGEVMNNPFTNAIIVVCALSALASWLGYFYWAFRMIRGRKEGVSAFGARLWWNPFNICFRPSFLTQEGLLARSWFFVCSGVLPLSILLMLWVSGAFENK
jgi:hypothetical protein